MRARSCLLLVFAAACIERPQDLAHKARQIDRTALADVIHARVPVVNRPIRAVFDDTIEFVGYDVAPSQPKVGEQVEVTFWWRALDFVDDDWQVFVHLEDETEANARQTVDHFPAESRYRTHAWQEGEIIADHWSFRAGNAPGRIRILTGLYRGPERMPLSLAGSGKNAGSNRLQAGVIIVR